MENGEAAQSEPILLKEKEVLGLDENAFRLYDAFHRLMRSHYKAMNAFVTDSSIPPAQARCLMVLEHKEGLCQRELADLLHIEKATATVMLQKMQRNGLIDRRQDAEDQRVTRIYLTAYGCRKNQELKSAFAMVLKEGMSCINDEDKVRLAAMLNKVADKFHEIQKKH